MEITIELTIEQETAMNRLGLEGDMQELCERAVASAIKGKFKYFAEKAEQETSKSYDWAIRSGAKFDKDKGAFVSQYMHEIRDILNNL